MKGNGLIGLDRMITIEAKLDVVMNKLGNSERRMHTTHEVVVVDERIRRSVEEVVGKSPTKLRKPSI